MTPSSSAPAQQEVGGDRGVHAVLRRRRIEDHRERGSLAVHVVERISRHIPILNRISHSTDILFTVYFSCFFFTREQLGSISGFICVSLIHCYHLFHFYSSSLPQVREVISQKKKKKTFLLFQPSPVEKGFTHRSDISLVHLR